MSALLEPATCYGGGAPAFGSKNPKVEVWDAIMGAGKTYTLIEELAKDIRLDLGRAKYGITPRRWLIIVPLLTEVARYVDDLSKHGVAFQHPEPIDGKGKLRDLSALVDKGENIVCTHALFKMLNHDIYKKIMGWRYNLIVDEVIETVRPVEEISREETHVRI